MNKHTPGPWEICWYDCRMDKDDVKHAHSEGNTNAKVGDILWRRPTQIGPCGIENSHWGGNLLDVEEADARLIAAAPDLLEALKAASNYIDTLGGVSQSYRAAIAKATGEQA